jgi:hypothetical protein
MIVMSKNLRDATQHNWSLSASEPASRKRIADRYQKGAVIRTL